MNFFEEVKEKINKKFSPENITLIDNSSLHVKHKSFDKNKFDSYKKNRKNNTTK